MQNLHSYSQPAEGFLKTQRQSYRDLSKCFRESYNLDVLLKAFLVARGQEFICHRMGTSSVQTRTSLCSI